MKIALALGGGGAKGIAHIGVLQVLEREGIEVAAIAGTSIGGLIGAVYAAGYSAQEMLERFTQIDQSRLFTSAGNAGPSLLGVAGISEVLSELLGDRTFDDLRIPLAVTAVDMHTGLDVELSRGRVLDAVLATIAVPGIFPPKPLGAYMLIDGGISNAIPVNLARSLAPDVPVLAVLLHMSREMQRHLPDPDFFGPLPIVQRIARMRVAQAFNIFMQSITISGQALSDLRLAQEKPDLIMRIDTADIGLLDRVDITSLAHRGEVVAEKALADLHRILSWPRRLAYRLGLGRIFQK